MDLTDTLRDAAYITIGAALIGLNKAQVARREALQRFAPQLEEGRRAVSKLCAQVRENLTAR
jgi:hypothetical protein